MEVVSASFIPLTTTRLSFRSSVFEVSSLQSFSLAVHCITFVANHNTI